MTDEIVDSKRLETKFSIKRDEDISIEYGFPPHPYWTYSVEEVDDWFKRCIDNYPNRERDSVLSYPYAYIESIHLWVERWFSQFKET